MGRSTACLRYSPRRGARRGTRAVRVCTGEARALQGAAQHHLRQRATQNCDRQDSEIYFESETACDRSAVSHFRLLSALNLSTTIANAVAQQQFLAGMAAAQETMKNANNYQATSNW